MSSKNGKDPWKSISNFSPADFKCKCGKCSGLRMDIDVVKKLDQMRELVGLPFKIMFGSVCAMAGTKGPKDFALEHFPDPDTGETYAVDIACPTQGEAASFRYAFLKAALEVGFKRIELGRSYIHVDDHPKNKTEVIWLRW